MKRYEIPKTEFNVHGSVHRKNILIYIQQDATLHSLFFIWNLLNLQFQLFHDSGK
jgi:hypothetical protein